MPRYDRTGPVGAGSRTGRGLGRCGRPADGTRPVEDPYQDEGTEWFGQPWGGGRGRRRGSGMGGRASQDAAGSDLTPRRRQAFLRRRIQELTAQLDRVNKLFSGDSPDGTQDEE